MSGILDNLASLQWWFAVVVAGFLVNLLAAYAKPRLDSVGSRTFRWWANRSAASRAHRETRLAALADDPHRQLLQTMEAQRLRLEATEGIVLAAIFSVVGQSSVAMPARVALYGLAALQAIKALALRVASYSTDMEAHEASLRRGHAKTRLVPPVTS